MRDRVWRFLFFRERGYVLETIEGYVEKIMFKNDENGYHVLAMKNKDGEFVSCGMFSGVSEGDGLKIDGNWFNHASYGRQFKAESYSINPPSDKESAYRYLASGAIKGVGQITALRIVQRFGDRTWEVLENTPEALAQIAGISKKKAIDIGSQIKEKTELRGAIAYLSQYGISNLTALKIYEKYGQKLYQVVRENPYRLADDIDGIGFVKADEIAIGMGLSTDSDYRINACITYSLGEVSESGHTCYPYEGLLEVVKNRLGVEIEDADWEQFIYNLIVERKIVMHKEGDVKYLYLPYLYKAEKTTGVILKNFTGYEDLDEDAFFKKIDIYLNKKSIDLDEVQRAALFKCASNQMSVITGGPGTGKTTIIETLIDYFEDMGEEIVLAAPTGRAAKRMTQATGRKAQTIHRLLEFGSSENGDNIVGRDEDNPVEADVVIIDEMSMVDINLMYLLLKALDRDTRIIMVGDPDQLPSVGPGNVLGDIIEAFPEHITRLEHVYRQSEDSTIASIAHDINAGIEVDFSVKRKDFYMAERIPEKICAALKPIITSQMPSYRHTKPIDIQVLSPVKKGEFGVAALNQYLQSLLNPADARKHEMTYGDVIFREGDKVMHIKNNYQLEWKVIRRGNYVVDTGMGVYNGDTGIISEVNTYAGYIDVIYDYDTDSPKTVRYKTENYNELELAYAITIHKSQGSEYDDEILVLGPGIGRLMTRNLIYTAVTRAKKCICIIGSQNIFNSMVKNNSITKRYSNLKSFCENT